MQRSQQQQSQATNGIILSHVASLAKYVCGTCDYRGLCFCYQNDFVQLQGTCHIMLSRASLSCELHLWPFDLVGTYNAEG